MMSNERDLELLTALKAFNQRTGLSPAVTDRLDAMDKRLSHIETLLMTVSPTPPATPSKGTRPQEMRRPTTQRSPLEELPSNLRDVVKPISVSGRPGYAVTHYLETGFPEINDVFKRCGYIYFDAKSEAARAAKLKSGFWTVPTLQERIDDDEEDSF